MPSARGRRFAPWGLVLLTSVWVSPFFVRVRVPGFPPGERWFQVEPAGAMANVRNPDVVNAYTHLSLTRLSLFRFGQFPWRTHLVGGGTELIGHPRDISLSPLVLPALLFGEEAGMKLITASFYYIGALGTYCLCRSALGLSPLGSFYAGAMMIVSAWLPARLLSGNYDEWHFMLFPLILACFIQARQNWRCIISAAMLFYVVMLDGKYILPILFLYLALFCGAEVVKRAWRRERRWWEPVPRLAAVAVLVALLGAVKIIPMTAMLKTDDKTREDRYAVEYRRHSWVQVTFVLEKYAVWGMMGHGRSADGEVVPAWRSILRLGMGTLAPLLALVGLVLGPHRIIGWLLFVLLSFWLSFWASMPVDLFWYLSRLPLYRSINSPDKYFNWGMLLGLAVMGGWAITRLGGTRHVPWRRAIAAVLVVLGVGEPVVTNVFAQQQLFTAPSVARSVEPVFYPVVATNRQRDLHRQFRDYFYINRNIGVINWYDPLDLPRAAVPKVFIDDVGTMTPNPEYRGEAYIRDQESGAGGQAGRGTATCRLLELTPNRIRVEIATDTPATLVINQNFDPHWRADRGTVASVPMPTPAYLLIGLDDTKAPREKYDRTRREFRQLAVSLDAPFGGVLTLRYRPWPAYVGAAISALTWLACLGLLLRAARRRRRLGRADERA
jgi:hypothetical protein